jgi:RimJ/RimL family protein N-acetyltransferase
VIRTERLILREWRDEDLVPFAAMGQDREVMEFFPTLLDREGSAAMIERIRTYQGSDGFSFWAVEVAGGDPFIGFAGLGRPRFTAPFTPCVEIGWRFARDAWGKGYATEAARGALDHAFGTLELDEVVAFLVPENRRSAAVCERIGMTRDPDGDFDHPNIAPGTISVGGHPIQRHALYRLTMAGWKARQV